MAQLPALRRRLLAVAGYCGVAAVVVVIGRRMATVEAYDIATLAFARSAERAAEIRTGVDDAVTRAAVHGDFVFIAGYGCLLAGGALVFGPRAFRARWFRIAAAPVAALVAVGAGCDVVENLAMLNGLRTGSDRPWQVAAVAAGVKFGLLGVGAVYVLTVLVGSIGWPRPPRTTP